MNRSALVLAALSISSAAFAAINIEAVPVGDVGNAADTAAHSGNPAGQGSVNYGYNIGKYEVTAGQYTAFLNAVAKTDTNSLYNASQARTDFGSGISQSGVSGSYVYSVDPAFVNRPVNYVSFWDACRFTNWLQNGQPTGDQNALTTEDGAYTLTSIGIATDSITRNAGWTWAVTSEDEWYKAAYYKAGGTSAGYWTYATRSDTAPGNDVADPFGNNANHRSGLSAFPIQSPYYITMAGEYQNSASAYDTFDQNGRGLGSKRKGPEAQRGCFRSIRSSTA